MAQSAALANNCHWQLQNVLRQLFHSKTDKTQNTVQELKIIEQ